MNRANFRKKSLQTLILGLTIIQVFASCSSNEQNTQKTTGKSIKYKNTITVSLSRVTRFYEAVGTIRSANEASIEAQITGQIKKVLVAPGASVLKGQPLVILDDREYTSRHFRAKEGLRSSKAQNEQAKQRLEAAKASLNQAVAEYNRTKKFFESQAATAQQLENAESAWKQAIAGEKNAIESLKGAESGIKQAIELVKQAEITLGYTTVRAPANGTILKKTAEVGDIALPGRQLLLVRTNSLLRIEANVREGLISQVSTGQKLDVAIKNLDLTIKAIVNEIEPYADPLTRTFLVKAELPQIKGLYPGMYGKLLIPEKYEEAVTIPLAAIKKVGQLNFVMVKEKDDWYKRYITTGMTIGASIEVLSGLSGSEVLGY